MPELEETLYDCAACGRNVKPARAVALYGEDEGVIVWSGGPYGAVCAAKIARARWKLGQMTYREPTGPNRRPYRFRGVPFGAEAG